jgi:hypothetical protein
MFTLLTAVTLLLAFEEGGVVGLGRGSLIRKGGGLGGV